MSITLSIDESVLDNKKKKITTKVSGTTVGECLNCFVKVQAHLAQAIFDKNGRLNSGNLVKVNSKYISTNPLTKPVKDGDQIEIFKFTGE